MRDEVLSRLITMRAARLVVLLIGKHSSGWNLDVDYIVDDTLAMG